MEKLAKVSNTKDVKTFQLTVTPTLFVQLALFQVDSLFLSFMPAADHIITQLNTKTSMFSMST